MSNSVENALVILKAAREDLPDDSTTEIIDEFIDKMETPMIVIHPDPTPENPREAAEHCGVMFCEYPRHTLGDKAAEDPFVENDVWIMDGHRMDQRHWECAVESMQCLAEDADLSDAERIKVKATVQALIFDCEETTDRQLRSDIAIALPLFLYEHSGMTIRHGPFGDLWDSGLVGIHYMTRTTLDKEFAGDETAARACLAAELAEYDAYLRGNCWYYTVVDRATGKVLDTCGGFIGSTLEGSGIPGNLPGTDAAAIESAWDERFEHGR